jgi:hypothetical protein
VSFAAGNAADDWRHPPRQALATRVLRKRDAKRTVKHSLRNVDKSAWTS